MIRDIPKYERSLLEEQDETMEGSDTERPRDSIEDVFFAGRSGKIGRESEVPY